MFVLKKALYSEITKFSKLLIYGAGDFANKIYVLLKNAGLQKMVGSFVVTKLTSQRDIDGIPVICVDELESYYGENCAVLIAVSSSYEDEIVHILQAFHDVRILKFTDYIIQDDDLTEMLRKQDDQQFMESVVEEYVWNHISSVDEFSNKRKETTDQIEQKNMKKTDENLIVSVMGGLTPRSEKIIGSLVKSKYRIIVLEYGYGNKLIEDEIMSYDIEFFHCKDMMEVLYRAMQYKPLVYYCEPVWGDCSGPEIMLRHRDLFGKIVFTTYDVLNDGYVQVSEEQKLSERYCLENADGIVWRWFSKQFLEETKGFHFKGKSIQFLDYCKGNVIQNDTRLDHELRICFVQGGIYDLLDADVFTNSGDYVEPARIDLILNKFGNIRDCVFHMYIGECGDSDRKKIEELEKKYSNFKCFYGTPHNELIDKISKYDYGCSFWTNGKDIPELETTDGIYYGSLHLHSIANRYFDYLDANIPIIATRPKMQCEYLEKFGVLIRMDLSNIDIDYLRKNKAFYKSNVEKAKTQLLMDNHIQRLIDFFNDL